MTLPAVFISSSAEQFDVARALAEQLDSVADVVVWSGDLFRSGKTSIEALAEMTERLDFAVVVVPGNHDVDHGKRDWQARSNVMFELGMLVGRLGPARTCVLVSDRSRVSLPSALDGTPLIALESASNPVEFKKSIVSAAATIQKEIAQIRTPRRAAIDFYSCFISYSWNDQDFASRIYDDLQASGVRCWLDARDMRIGDRIHQQVLHAIQLHDKMLLVLSEASVRSEWVRQELRGALRLEQARGKTVLFPVCLDQSVLEATDVSEFDQLRQRYIIDFTNWRDAGKYRKAFSRLMRDLAINASVETEGRSNATQP